MPQTINESILEQVIADLERADYSIVFADENKQYIERAYRKVGQAQGELIVTGFSFDISTKFAQDNINRLTTTFAKDVTKTALKEIKSVLKNAIAEGMSIYEAKKAIEVLGEKWAYRAEVVARTEILRASNMGTLNAWMQSGVVEEKVWHTAPDACPICFPLDGTTVSLSEPFFKQGAEIDYIDETGDEPKMKTYTCDYSDVEAGSLHPNCRCTILAVIK